jgi:hypothetical protein
MFSEFLKRKKHFWPVGRHSARNNGAGHDGPPVRPSPRSEMACGRDTGACRARPPRSGLVRWHDHRRRAGALGVAGPRPRASMLHGECAERPKDGGAHRPRVATSRRRRRFVSGVL